MKLDTDACNIQIGCLLLQREYEKPMSQSGSGPIPSQMLRGGMKHPTPMLRDRKGRYLLTAILKRQPVYRMYGSWHTKMDPQLSKHHLQARAIASLFI